MKHEYDNGDDDQDDENFFLDKYGEHQEETGEALGGAG